MNNNLYHSSKMCQVSFFVSIATWMTKEEILDFIPFALKFT
ncbi:hypothetical protein N499_0354 [Wolbachia pipientis wVitA]|nr:hypothetical protein N500_0638 [Wolbachia pipientis wUni]ONI57991.1 hypothetical protein N499_0354 [Wolbachia pipientis wVitA]